MHRHFIKICRDFFHGDIIDHIIKEAIINNPCFKKDLFGLIKYFMNYEEIDDCVLKKIVNLCLENGEESIPLIQKGSGINKDNLLLGLKQSGNVVSASINYKGISGNIRKEAFTHILKIKIIYKVWYTIKNNVTGSK